MELNNGTYIARPMNAVLATTKGGKEQVAVAFELLNEDVLGHVITWFGFFTDATWKRTIEALQFCGWQGDDLSDLSSVGQGDARVSLVIENEEYEGQVRPRVRWVNKEGQGPTVSNPMDQGAAKRFAASMRAKMGSVAPAQRPPAPPSRPAGGSTARPAGPTGNRPGGTWTDDIPF